MRTLARRKQLLCQVINPLLIILSEIRTKSQEHHFFLIPFKGLLFVFILFQFFLTISLFVGKGRGGR